MPLLSRKRTILVAPETPYGTDATPSGADALLVREINPTPMESDVVSRDLIRPFLGASDQLLANVRVRMGFQVELAGSGAAGTAPRFGSLLQSCGFAATTLAAALTGSAQAGAANSITLASSGTSAVDGFYVGMPISITSGTGNGHAGIITAYNGTSKVATVKATTATFVPAASSQYSIGANVQYRPVSASFGSSSIYFNIDGVLHKALGSRGTFSLSMPLNQIPTLDFDMMGIYVEPTDTAAPTVVFTNQATPKIFNSNNSKGFSLLGFSGCLSSISMDLANEMVYRELVGCNKEVLITDRNPTGEFVIEAPTIATKNFWNDATSDATGLFTIAHGTTGNGVSIVAPKMDINNPTYSDQDGIHMLNIPCSALPGASGNDELIFTFY